MVTDVRRRIPDLAERLAADEPVIAWLTARGLHPLQTGTERAAATLAGGISSWHRATIVATPRRLLVWKDDGWIRSKPTGAPLEIAADQLVAVTAVGSGPLRKDIHLRFRDGSLAAFDVVPETGNRFVEAVSGRMRLGGTV